MYEITKYLALVTFLSVVNAVLHNACPIPLDLKPYFGPSSRPECPSFIIISLGSSASRHRGQVMGRTVWRVYRWKVKALLFNVELGVFKY